MSLIFGIKNLKDKSYVLCSNISFSNASDTYYISKTNPREYHIQKFKNFFIAYNGSYIIFQDLVKNFDFNKFPKKLTKKWLLKNFYINYLQFLSGYNNGLEHKDNYIETVKFNIMIMGKDYLFDIGNSIYECEYYCVGGLNKEPSSTLVGLEEYYNGDYNDELLKKLFDVAAITISNITYPFMVVSSKDFDHYKIYNEDGSVTLEKTKLLW